MILSEELEKRLKDLLQQAHLSDQELEELQDLSKRKFLSEEAEVTVKEEEIERPKFSLENQFEDPEDLDGEDADKNVTSAVLTHEEQIGQALIAAAKQGNVKKVASLLQCIRNVGQDAVIDESLYKALFVAAKYGHTDIVTLLVQPVKDAEIEEGYEGDKIENPFIAAAEHGHTKTVSLLLPHIENRDGGNVFYIAIKLAAANGHVETIKFLLQDPDLYEYGDGYDGFDYPLVAAATEGRLEMLEYLGGLKSVESHIKDELNKDEEGFISILKDVLEGNPAGAYLAVKIYQKMGIKLKFSDQELERYNFIKETFEEIHDALEESLPREIGNLILEKAELPKNDNIKKSLEKRSAYAQNLIASVDQVIDEQAKLKTALEQSLDELVLMGVLKKDELAGLRSGEDFEKGFSESIGKLVSVKESIQTGIRRLQDSIEKLEIVEGSQEVGVPDTAPIPSLHEKGPLPSLQELATDYLIDEFLRLDERTLLTKLHGQALPDQAKRGFAILEAIFKQSIVAVEQAQVVLKTAELTVKDRPLDKDTQESFELIKQSLTDLLQARVVFRKMRQAIGKSFSNPSSILRNIERLLQLATKSAKVIQERTQHITKRLEIDKALSISGQAVVEDGELCQGFKKALMEVDEIFQQAHQLIEQSDALFGVQGKQDKSREMVIACLSNILGAKASILVLKAQPDSLLPIQVAVQSAKGALTEIQAKLKAVEEAAKALDAASAGLGQESSDGDKKVALDSQELPSSDLGKKPSDGGRQSAFYGQKAWGHLQGLMNLGQGSMPVDRTVDGRSYCEPDVPGDGTCLFYSTVLAYLLPVVDDAELFKKRFVHLFGEEVAGSAEENRQRLLKYDGNSRFIQRHAEALEVLVNVNFRKRLVDFMKQHKAELSGFVTTAEDFDTRLERMGDPGRKEWGDQPEIEAISRFLKMRVTVYRQAGKEIMPMGNLGDHGQEYPERIYLVHTAANPRIPSGKNHYHYLVEKRHLSSAIPKDLKDVKEAKETKEAKEAQEAAVKPAELAAKAAEAAEGDLAKRLGAVQLEAVQIERQALIDQASSSSSFGSDSSQSSAVDHPAAKGTLKRKENPAVQDPIEQDFLLPDGLSASSVLAEGVPGQQRDPQDASHQSKSRRRHSPSRADERPAFLAGYGSLSASSLAAGPENGQQSASNETSSGNRANLKRKSRTG